MPPDFIAFYWIIACQAVLAIIVVGIVYKNIKPKGR